MVFYVIQTCLYFAVYLAILQLGVRTFVAELTASFQGIADKLLPGSVPGVDCAVIFGFGAPNAVTLGFLAGFIGQIVAIATLVLLKSPVLVICGFVPVFFDNATIGVFVNEKRRFEGNDHFRLFRSLPSIWFSAHCRMGWNGCIRRILRYVGLGSGMAGIYSCDEVLKLRRYCDRIYCSVGNSTDSVPQG